MTRGGRRKVATEEDVPMAASNEPPPTRTDTKEGIAPRRPQNQSKVATLELEPTLLRYLGDACSVVHYFQWEEIFNIFNAIGKKSLIFSKRKY